MKATWWEEDPFWQEDIDRLLAITNTPSANVFELLCSRHAADRIAFTVVDRDSTAVAITYGELADKALRLASLLRERGVRRGDRVAVLMGKSQRLPVVLLAVWALGAVHVPLFTAFAGPAIAMRVNSAQARMVLCDPEEAPKCEGLSTVTVLAVDATMESAAAAYQPLEDTVAIGGDGEFIRLFTSGTTGSAKGVPVPVRALASFSIYMEYGLEVKDTDVYWNAADPGWAYGLYYGIVGPLFIGQSNILLEGGFSAKSTAALIQTLGVTNFAAAPTVYRSLQQANIDISTALRRASSCGEPLPPSVSDWSLIALGTRVRDHYGQTELGIAIADAWGSPDTHQFRSGSMGRSMPGFVGSVVDGRIAISVNRSSLFWFTSYADEPDKTKERFTSDGAWYLTGDVGRIDGESFYFSARDDDVIIMAGYRIGPFDIENVLLSHEAVAEVAVAARPDALRGEAVEAFVVLRPGATASTSLELELQVLVRDQYAKHAYPRRVHFVKSLPRTPSGKIQRYLIRAEGVEACC